MTAYTARANSSNQLTNLVSLTAHGFFVGQAVIYNGAWVLSKADSLPNCAGTMIVSIVPSPDEFYVTQVGDVNNLNELYFDEDAIVAGEQYYLSNLNAGNFTLIAPVAIGQVILPCLNTDTVTSGYFFGGSGTAISYGLPLNIVTANTNMLANQRYSTNSAATLNMTLPTNMSVGDRIIVSSQDTGGFKIIQPALATIIYGLNNTTVGTAGYIESAAEGSTVELMCVINDGVGLGYELLVTNSFGEFQVN